MPCLDLTLHKTSSPPNFMMEGGQIARPYEYGFL
jgi:hypothetical protein